MTTTTRSTKRHVWLVGFSGSGKSTIGPKLAKALRMAFADTDRMIEQQTGMSIADLFAMKGEKFFRLMERKALAKVVVDQKPTVVALGGGAFQPPYNRALIQKVGVTVHLGVRVQTVMRRLQDTADRPLLQVRPKGGETARTAQQRRISELLAKRERNYMRADIVVSTENKTPAQIVKTIQRRLKELHA